MTKKKNLTGQEVEIYLDNGQKHPATVVGDGGGSNVLVLVKTPKFEFKVWVRRADVRLSQ